MIGKTDHKLPIFGEHSQSEDFRTDLRIFAVHLIEITDFSQRDWSFILRLYLFGSIDNRCRLFSLRQNLKALFLHILLPAVIGKHIGSAEQNTAVIGCIKVFHLDTVRTNFLNLTASAVIHDNITDSKIGNRRHRLLLCPFFFKEKFRHFGKAEAVAIICRVLIVH